MFAFAVFFYGIIEKERGKEENEDEQLNGMLFLVQEVPLISIHVPHFAWKHD